MSLFESGRIVGFEEEFGTECRKISGSKSPINYSPKNRYLGYKSSGGRLDLDYNDLLSRGLVEYATPEHTSLRHCVAAIIAGRQITNAATANMRTAELELRAGYSRDMSVGSHENYQSSLSYARIVDGALPFFLTRHLLTGSGGVNYEGDPAISPRLARVSTIMHEHSALKSFFRMKSDEGITETEQRIEVTCGDHSLTDVALFLRIGITALVLQLVEDGKAPQLGYIESMWQKDLERLNKIDPSGWRLEGAGWMSAIDVQREYCKAVALYVAHTDEAREVVQLWNATLDDLECMNMDSLAKTVGWASRHRTGMLEEAIYGHLSDEPALSIVTPALVASAKMEPLDSTRAKARTRVLRDIFQHFDDITDLQVRWGSIYAVGRYGETKFEFPDPGKDYVLKREVSFA